MKLRKVSANEPAFIYMKSRFNSFFEEYKDYAQMLTDQAGKVKKSSGKAGDYRNYLIKMFVLFEENDLGTVSNPYLTETLENIARMFNYADFVQFNRDEHNFFSAPTSCWRSFLVYKNSPAEDIVDGIPMNYSKNTNTTIVSEPEPLYDGPRPRKEKIRNQETGLITYPRNLTEAEYAKKRSNWQCELNPYHKTFLSKNGKVDFVEAHHLIPMAAQDFYKNTLDFADNIVALCPNCHRLVHNAVEPVRKEALIELYKKRKNRYIIHGINVSQKEFLNYYGIL